MFDVLKNYFPVETKSIEEAVNSKINRVGVFPFIIILSNSQNSYL